MTSKQRTADRRLELLAGFAPPAPRARGRLRRHRHTIARGGAKKGMRLRLAYLPMRFDRHAVAAIGHRRIGSLRAPRDGARTIPGAVPKAVLATASDRMRNGGECIRRRYAVGTSAWHGFPATGRCDALTRPRTASAGHCQAEAPLRRPGNVAARLLRRVPVHRVRARSARTEKEQKRRTHRDLVRQLPISHRVTTAEAVIAPARGRRSLLATSRPRPSARAARTRGSASRANASALSCKACAAASCWQWHHETDGAA